MKRLTAILLVIALSISACAAPAGASGETGIVNGETGSSSEQADITSEETGSQSGEAAEDLTEAEWTSEDRADREGGFVPAEKPKEEPAEETQESAEEQPAEEFYEASEEQESKPGLVILEEDNDDYRGAAGLKASDIDEKTSQLHAVTNGSGGSKTGGKTAAKAVKDYTVMVYIVGSNLESRLGAATTDIGEMKQAGIDFGKTNLLVYTGGSRRWVSDIPNKYNSVLDLSTAGGSQIIAQTGYINIEKVDMPDAAAGFSLGEVAAAAACGLFDMETGFRLVCRRGELMQREAEKQDTSMAAVVKLTEEQVREICGRHKDVYPVNFNCPGQVTVSGLSSQMTGFMEDVKAAGGRAIPLKVKGAFHSPFMRKAADEFADTLAQAEIRENRVPLYSNMTAGLYAGNAAELLSGQICSPVLWEKIIRNMISDGVETFIEIGPGKTLCNMIKRISSDVTAVSVTDYLSEVEAC